MEYVDIQETNTSHNKTRGVLSPVTPETLYRPLGGASVPGRFHCLMGNTGSPGGRQRSTMKNINRVYSFSWI